MNAVVDSISACKFVFFACYLEEYANTLTAVTGVETSAQDLMFAGERIYYNERIMNSLNGFDIDDDNLPERLKHLRVAVYSRNGGRIKRNIQYPNIML